MTKDGILDSIVAKSANNMITWWLMASYLYYHKDTSILSDGRYDALCNQLHSDWEKVDHRHKYAINRDLLTALDLIEVSVVSVASNPLATVTEKAAAFLYGSPDDDDPEGDDDEKSGDDAPAVKTATDEAATAALEAIATAREALDLAEAALAPADDEDEPAEDDPAAEDVPSDSAGTKGLSARARVALAMIALPSAETE